MRHRIAATLICVIALVAAVYLWQLSHMERQPFSDPNVPVENAP